MKQVMVRVKTGCRLRENGTTYVENQVLWVYEDRLTSLLDLVDLVGGVEPKRDETKAAVVAENVRTTAMAEPSTPRPQKMPKPDARLLGQPRVIPAKKKK